MNWLLKLRFNLLDTVFLTAALWFFQQGYFFYWLVTILVGASISVLVANIQSIHCHYEKHDWIYIFVGEGEVRLGVHQEKVADCHEAARLFGNAVARHCQHCGATEEATPVPEKEPDNGSY